MNRILRTSIPLLLFFTLGCSSGTENPKNEQAADIPGKPLEDSQGPEEVGEKNGKTIVFFGDSLTAGFGIDVNEAFPAITQQIIDSLNLDYTVVNAGLSGETTAGGLKRLDWVLKEAPEVFILELGGNDGLRGIPHAETASNLQEMIDMVKQRGPDTKIILAGMESPPNMGVDYTDGFRQVFRGVADANPDIAFIPFLLEGVGGEEDLNQNDGIHPTEEGHKLVADHVWKTLGPML